MFGFLFDDDAPAGDAFELDDVAHPGQDVSPGQSGDSWNDPSIIQDNTDGMALGSHISLPSDSGGHVLSGDSLGIDWEETFAAGLQTTADGYLYVDEYTVMVGSENSLGESDIVGDLQDMQHWHRQEMPDSCGVAVQEFVLEKFMGADYAESDLRDYAEQCGWYEIGGTRLNQLGRILEAYGIPVERQSNATLDDIETKLESDDGVMIVVNEQLWNTGRGDDTPLAELNGSGRDTQHAVQVIGIDRSDADNVRIILNDPADVYGRGRTVTWDELSEAWSSSDNYMVSTNRSLLTGEPLVAGYHDQNGLYHWSDGSIEPNYNWSTGYI